MRIARLYDPPRPGDGLRVLVDRLWPRGVRKDDPRIDRWIKDVAPSTSLRKWYSHDPDRFGEFVARYEHELDDTQGAAALGQLRELAAQGPITLLTSTKDLAHSHLVVLEKLLNDEQAQ